MTAANTRARERDCSSHFTSSTSSFLRSSPRDRTITSSILLSSMISLSVVIDTRSINSNGSQSINQSITTSIFALLSNSINVLSLSTISTNSIDPSTTSPSRLDDTITSIAVMRIVVLVLSFLDRCLQYQLAILNKPLSLIPRILLIASNSRVSPSPNNTLLTHSRHLDLGIDLPFSNQLVVLYSPIINHQLLFFVVSLVPLNQLSLSVLDRDLGNEILL